MAGPAAAGGDALGDGEADAAGAAGDGRDAALEIECVHGSSPPALKQIRRRAAPPGGVICFAGGAGYPASRTAEMMTMAEA